MLYSGFDWDAGNTEKCLKHGVSIAEIEDIFSADPLIGPDVLHSAAETRFRAFGRIKSGRALFVVFTLRENEDRKLVRPISARYMLAKEVAHYDAFIAKS